MYFDITFTFDWLEVGALALFVLGYVVFFAAPVHKQHLVELGALMTGLGIACFIIGLLITL